MLKILFSTRWRSIRLHECFCTRSWWIAASMCSISSSQSSSSIKPHEPSAEADCGVLTCPFPSSQLQGGNQGGYSKPTDFTSHLFLFKHVSHGNFKPWTFFFLYDIQNCNKRVRKIHIKTSWIGWRNFTFIAGSQSRIYLCAHSQFIKLAEITALTTGYVTYGRRHTGTVNAHHRYLIVRLPPQAVAYRKGNIQFLGLTPCSGSDVDFKGRSQDVCGPPVVFIHLNQWL